MPASWNSTFKHISNRQTAGLEMMINRVKSTRKPLLIAKNSHVAKLRFCATQFSTGCVQLPAKKEKGRMKCFQEA
jgi:hypothetical protein